MKALRDMILAPFKERIVARYLASGTYSVQLSAGRYRVALAGSGGGAAVAGNTSSTDATTGTKTGRWGLSSGGGGGLIIAEFRLLAGAEAQIKVESGVAGAASVVDAAESQTAESASITIYASEFKCGNIEMYAICGNGGGTNPSAYVYAPASAGSIVTRAGKGGANSFAINAEEVAVIDGGNGNTATKTELETGTLTTVDGGVSGATGVPELGDAGKARAAILQYDSGESPVGLGEDGYDGGAVVWRIG